MPLLQQLSSEDLATRVDFMGLRNDPAVAYLNRAIRHPVPHRGQISAYLSPMGAKVSAIYGESADEDFIACILLGRAITELGVPEFQPQER